MNRRDAIILASLWAFLAVPNLCTMGVLTHACEQHASDDCGHESDCNHDPCARFTAAATPSFRVSWLDSLQHPAPAILCDALVTVALPTPHLISEPKPPRKGSPAPGNGLPLLI